MKHVQWYFTQSETRALVDGKASPYGIEVSYLTLRRDPAIRDKPGRRAVAITLCDVTPYSVVLAQTSGCLLRAADAHVLSTESFGSPLPNLHNTYDVSHTQRDARSY